MDFMEGLAVNCLEWRKVPDLTPIIISVGQLMADDGSDPAVVHRPGSRKGDGS